MKAGFTVFLLLLLIDLPPTLGRKCGRAKCIHKVREHSHAPVDLPKLCGDSIMKVFIDICQATVWAKRRKRRRDISPDLFVQTKNEAQDFLSFKRRRRSTHHTDVVEECCGEGCRTEELMEYC